MKFVVSKGYVVIGVRTALDNNGEFQRILAVLTQLKQDNLVDTSKIGLMGASTGGGRMFHVLRRLKEQNFAATNFLISLDGYVALDEPIQKVRGLESTTLLLQFGGADGLDYRGHENGDVGGPGNIEDRYQDPRILMALYNILPGNEKSLSFLNNNIHGYAGGSMVGKDDMLTLVGAMMSYRFGHGGVAARNVALDNLQYNEIDNNKVDENRYRFKCNAYGNNYCDVNNPTSKWD